MKTHHDLRTLQAFVTVAREGNVTRAAELLHVTQPAVSLQLRRLANDTGLTLFCRTPAGLELTRDGAALVIKAERVLSSLMDFSQTARRLTGKVRGRLRIGTIIDPDFIRLGALLRALVESAPDLQTELVHGMSGDVPTGLEKGAVDAGYFLGETDFEHSADPYHRQELARFCYWVIAPPGWENTVMGKSWSDLSELPWIGTPAASVHHRLLKSTFAEHGAVQNTVALVDQESSMLAMVRSGVGLSLCRDSVALSEKQSNGVVINDIVELPTSLSFICHANRRQEPNIDAVFQVLSSVWPEGLEAQTPGR
ncbi:MAG: LysR family transcriptional regulator [Pseudomonadota bacterium]